MESQRTDKNPKVSRITFVDYLLIPLPCILIGALLGAIVGSALDNDVNGMRVGIILGGVVAFIILQNKKRNAS